MRVVDFKQNSTAIMANLRPLNYEDLTKLTPRCFDNDYDGHAIMSLSDVIGMIFPNGDASKKPYLYIRHTDMLKHQFRFGNIIELGDDFLSPQKGATHITEIGQEGVSITEYRNFSNELSGYDVTNPPAQFRFNKEGYSIREGEVLKLNADKWPLAIYDHVSMYQNVSTIIQAATYYGTYESKPVLGLGEHDRLFIPTDINGFDGITNKFGYFYMNMMGVREDGRREQALISINFAQGKNLAYYFIDGEQPIITDHVSLETEWYHLPYVDDGTCVYKDATFRFCGKELHFKGKWGSKGFTAVPRMNKHGQSQIFGTWYEGTMPYSHRLYMTFGENMEAYDYKLKEMGFEVIE